jgi:hypothetical protein
MMARSPSTESSWTSIRSSRESAPAVAHRTLHGADGLGKTAGGRRSRSHRARPGTGVFRWVRRRQGSGRMASLSVPPQSTASESATRRNHAADLAYERLPSAVCRLPSAVCRPRRAAAGRKLGIPRRLSRTRRHQGRMGTCGMGERLESRSRRGPVQTINRAKHRFLSTKALNRRKWCDISNVWVWLARVAIVAHQGAGDESKVGDQYE